MATQEEKQLLIDTLKFTPRTYKIQMWGYGGEKVMGTVSQEVWNYCMENQVDLSDIAWDSDSADEMELDPDKLPFPPGSWYECDDMGHTNGVSRNSGTLQIEDENGNVVFEKSLEACDGITDSPCWNCIDEVWIGSRNKGEIVFVGSSNEKGTFFEAELELKAPFDIEKLELCYEEFDGEEIVNSVIYDGEEIDNWGGGTDGKSSDFNMVRLLDDEGNFERYDPGSKDWGHPEHGTSPESWESSPKFNFKKHKPVHVGWYSAVWRSFGTTYGSLYWDGKEFGEWEYGKFIPQAGVESWQGFNWDTSSWVNRPPEPPNVQCNNTACGWVGMRDSMREDDEYNSHCPECDGTDFDWIDYDPDSKTGQKNRDKYCQEWDPALALERITVPEVTEKEKAELLAGLDQALADLAKESGIEFADGPGATTQTGKWPF